MRQFAFLDAACHLVSLTAQRPAHMHYSLISATAFHVEDVLNFRKLAGPVPLWQVLPNDLDAMKERASLKAFLALRHIVRGV